MMINPISYYRPRSLEDALKYTNTPGSIALAGGGLLLGGLNLPYESVVDLQDLSELKQISQSEAGWHIGGAATLEQVIQQTNLPAHVRTAITRTLPLNLRTGVSVAESLITPQPQSEWLAVLAALDAQVEHMGFRKGSLLNNAQRQPVLSFIDELRQHGYPYGGLITALHIPAISGILGSAFVARTPADLPIVSATAYLRLDAQQQVSHVSAIVTGATEAPAAAVELDMMNRQPLTADLIEKAAEQVPQQVSPVSDYRGSSDYRRQMAAVMVKRALMDCLAQVHVRD